MMGIAAKVNERQSQRDDQCRPLIEFSGSSERDQDGVALLLR